MPEDSTPAILAAIRTVQTGVDDLRARMDGMVTRAELGAEMRQVNARLDRVQASVGDERKERTEHVRGEREKRESEVEAAKNEFLDALDEERKARQAADAAERTARTDAEAAAKARVWKVLGLLIPALALLFTVIDRIFS